MPDDSDGRRMSAMSVLSERSTDDASPTPNKRGPDTPFNDPFSANRPKIDWTVWLGHHQFPLRSSLPLTHLHQQVNEHETWHRTFDAQMNEVLVTVPFQPVLRFTDASLHL